jgi:predicted DsbA family dithiol-disulfide isomerase
MKMKIEIWSDVVCPFCYISKKNFEKALSKFEHKNRIDVIWRSYELYPNMLTNPNKTYYEYLAERDEITVEEVELLYDFVLEMAQDSGLELNLEKTLILNTKKAHQLIQVAKTQNLSSEVGEQLFRACFVENKNIDDIEILQQIADKTGIVYTNFSTLLSSKEIINAFSLDIERSANKEINSVPYFLLNDNVAINGAQDVKVFTDMLEKAWKNFELDNQGEFENINGQSCSMDGNCLS